MRSYMEGSKEPSIIALKCQSRKNQSWEKSLITQNQDTLDSKTPVMVEDDEMAVDNPLSFSASSSSE
jgi:hypothetical protein